MRNWSLILALNRTLSGDRSEGIIDPVKQPPNQTPKGVSAMAVLAFFGLITAVFGAIAALSVVFGTDSRESSDVDPTRAGSTLRYA